MKIAAMIIKTLTTIAFILAALVCSGQSFVQKYSKLTQQNLSEFFSDWKAYSDSISAKDVITDSVLANVIRQEYAAFETENKKLIDSLNTKYQVFPRYIKVERYYLDVDTAIARSKLGFPSFIQGMRNDQYVADSITPTPTPDGLYLTKDIKNILSKFVGGIGHQKRTRKINKENLKELRTYIPASYGHWGGYWWFTSFPLINNICYADNLIAVMRRTGWSTGDVIWYVKGNGKFVRRQKPVTWWIE